MTTQHLEKVISYYEDVCRSSFFGTKVDNAFAIMFPLMRKMLETPTDREKLMRWLGFVQGILFDEGVFSIDDLRNHNRKNGPFDPENVHA